MNSSNNERRLFYIVGPDSRKNPSDFEFVNKPDALINTPFPNAYVWAGSHKYQIEGFKAPSSFGIPHLRTKPALVVGVDADELLDFYGLGMRYVSTRAKDLLCQIDPDAFEFAECATVDGAGRPVEPYWMMAVIRVVDQFDEDRSDVIWCRDYFSDEPEQADNPLLCRLNDVFFPSVSPKAHAFYLLRYRGGFIFDAVLADAWREAGLKGALFTPLQQPSAEEMSDADSFRNYPYWSKRG